jgi:hypothetical protein
MDGGRPDELYASRRAIFASGLTIRRCGLHWRTEISVLPGCLPELKSQMDGELGDLWWWKF